jgi:4-hydroxybenzoate polyprenyltransferase
MTATNLLKSWVARAVILARAQWAATRTRWPARRERLLEYARLMRLHRPVGIWLLGWPVLWALWLASRGLPDAWVLAVFLLGTVLMRSAGCVINDVADREFDPHVARTRDRPLAAGRISLREALILFAALVLAAFALVLSLDRLTLLLSCGGLLLAVIYPFTKRFVHMPQAVLGMAFAWGVPMAYAATGGGVTRAAGVIAIVVVLWAMAYDTLYAMVDREDDLRIGVKSTAILFGDMDLAVVGLLHASALLGLGLLGRMEKLGPWYWAGLAVAAGLAAHQLWRARRREPAACFQAFLDNQWYGAVVFAGIFLHFHGP